MDGFSKLPKMQCFKTGGSVKSEAYCGGGKAMKNGGEVDDEKQDKAMIKKAFKQHDRAEHDKEPTEIKLKKGGRSAKKEGSVRKFQKGGLVNNVYEAKKDSGDKDNIKKVKETKPKMIKNGGDVKKMNEGGSLAERLKNNVMGTEAQNIKAREDNARYLRAKKMQEAAGKQMDTGEKMAMGLADMEQRVKNLTRAGNSRLTNMDVGLADMEQRVKNLTRAGNSRLTNMDVGVGPNMPPAEPTAPPAGMPMQKRGGRAGKK